MGRRTKLMSRRNGIFVTLTRIINDPRYEVMFLRLGHNMECNQHDLPAILSSCTRHATFERAIKAKIRESDKNIISQAFRPFALHLRQKTRIAIPSSREEELERWAANELRTLCETQAAGFAAKCVQCWWSLIKR